MRILQLSDPHLVAADQGLVRGRPALAHFKRALQVGGALNPDLVRTFARTKAGVVMPACGEP